MNSIRLGFDGHRRHSLLPARMRNEDWPDNWQSIVCVEDNLIRAIQPTITTVAATAAKIPAPCENVRSREGDRQLWFKTERKPLEQTASRTRDRASQPQWMRPLELQQ